MVFRLTASRATLLPAMRFLVHRRPGTALRFALRYAPAFITLFDVFGLTFLLVGVAGFITSGMTTSFAISGRTSAGEHLSSCRWGFADGARPINAD